MKKRTEPWVSVDSRIQLSLIVTVYNKVPYIRDTLKSIRDQSLSELEVICIDDASTDGSSEVISEFVSSDSRFRCLRHKERCGVHCSRMDGISEAKGDYVWIIDGDDTLVPGICEKLSRVLNKNRFDIIHFGTKVVNENFLDEDRICSMQRFVEPFKGRLRGAEVLEGCFSENKYSFNLWNKLIRTDVAKKSIGEMTSEQLLKGQDKYEFFVIACNSSSYLGIPGIIAYEYHFGRGVTGHNVLDQDGFAKYVSMSISARAIFDYSSGKTEICRLCAENAVSGLFEDCVANWYRVREDLKPVCFDLMVGSWEPLKIVSSLARRNWYKQDDIARWVSGSKCLDLPRKKTSVIATYYHRMNNGGVQRVLSELISDWTDRGYSVVLITDEPPSPDDYPIPEGVCREQIPDYSKISKNDYYRRAVAFSAVLEKYHVDTFVNHAWVVNTLLWDLLACKLSGVRFVTNCHNVFAMTEGSGLAYFSALPYIYRLMDAVVVLSDVDRAFWSKFNHNVFEVRNPISKEVLSAPPASLSGSNVLWIGRISKEKNPVEIIYIFKMVHERLPQAKLTIVGDGQDSLKEEMRSLIHNAGLSDCIKLEGFSKEVISYYSEASVVVITSEYEGFLLTLAESLAMGVPVVVYDLPYLRILREGRGFVRVPQNDRATAAMEVCNLLCNPDVRRQLGEGGRSFIHEMYPERMIQEWDIVFGSLSSDSEKVPGNESEDLMWDTLFQFYRKGVEHNKHDMLALSRSKAYCVWCFVSKVWNALRKAD